MRNKHFKSIISLLLTVVMVLSAVFCVTAAESDVAKTGASGTVYFENTSNWSNLHCYMWNANGETKNADWPGQPMTQVEGNVFKYTTSTSYDNVIFNNGGNGQQTGDLQFPGDGQIYNGSSWRAYENHVTDPSQSTDPTQPSQSTDPTQPTQPNPSGTKMVYCKNTAGWSSVSCYMWSDALGNNGSWPGVTMTNIGENIWQYEVSNDWNMIIFNSGSDAQKTGDMSFPGDGYIYDNSTNKWEKYDTSPITVKSVGTDAASPQYKGCDITLSANAVSTGGTVYYKFSVVAADKTTVLADFSTKNSVVWSPTATGTYTLVYDFKDAAGNENQRKAEYVISDDSTVKAPIIKKVTPGSSQIKKGTATTIAVTAGGGKTGTNLLFYKFTIKDAAGKTVNVPYYTKTASYKFTPSALGTYTVTVSVQNSENDLAERTYTYQCVNEVVDDPEQPTETLPPQPTEPVGGDLRGDANADGEVTVIDATLVQQYCASIEVAFINLANANANLDEGVSVLDATMIQRFVAKLENW